ncbi:MAG TPA: N-acetylmuramoyl-L-alanine amidase [Verrucomicrobiae bacterium]|nr:N-acetylmuramoyl-L-alanine amidase [Verrucomicrobiae bacterium]
MKKAVSIFLLLLLLAPGLAGGANVVRLRPNYVSLNEWARANVFTTHWVERDKTFELTGRGARLTFNVEARSDARRAQINGVQVWLAFPVLERNGALLISETDLSETLGPVLSPPKVHRGIDIKTICLDPGHGGKDPGNRAGSNEEKKYTLLLAQEAAAQLRAAGFKVYFTRSSDSYVDLSTRPEIARRRGADVFVSLHFNSTEEGRGEVKGTEIFCCTPAGATSTNARGEGDTRWVVGNRNDEKNMLLAYQMQKSYAKNVGVEDRGVKRARFQVLREATMPAILIEGGFMSHPSEGRKIYDPAYRKQMARAIVNGIVAYKRAVKSEGESVKAVK